MFVARRVATDKAAGGADQAMNAAGIEYEIRSMKDMGVRAGHVAAPDARAAAGGLGSDSDADAAGIDKPAAKLHKGMSLLDKGLARQRSRRAGVPEKAVRDMHALELSLEKIEKGGYKHFMIKEIMEQPSVLRDCMRGRVTGGVVKLGGLSDHWPRITKARRIIITACGTSWHSALVGEYMIESLAKIPVEVEYASEFRYRNPIIHPEDVVVVISQSGETADTLEAIRIAKSKGALTLGFVNVVGSSIARATDAGAYLHVGPEIGVASTKAFSGQVMMLALFAVQLGLASGALAPERARELVDALQHVPEAVEKVLSQATTSMIQDMARTYRYASNFLFLGRGMNMPVALEGALKLKEISYVHAEGYPAAELKHGPIALIDRQMPVVIIAPRFDATYDKVKSSIEEVVARSGSVIVITDEGNTELDKLAEYVIRVPVVDEFCSPFVTVVPLQLLAYHIALFRGCAIDQPRNLAKSVTVE
jgi:glucosamine--fructose-6-phosphate aminotransferase (isomerizing)